jgi:hypothetical protein
MQTALQFQAIASRHVDIGDDTGRMGRQGGCEEGVCAIERLGHVSSRPHQSYQRTSDRGIVIHDVYGGRVLRHFDCKFIAHGCNLVPAWHTDYQTLVL